MELQTLFSTLATAFDGPEKIERHAQDALLSANFSAAKPFEPHSLPEPFLSVMAEKDAHPVCSVIARMPLPWAPPQTSKNPLYVAHSQPKVHVELLGPDGLVTSKTIRLGLYGMLPDFEYGIRTHPAEEVFVMLAGSAYWKRGSSPYQVLRSGERSYHPSMMPHANKTKETAFLSVYVWLGDISTDNYAYAGIPTL